VVVVEWLTASLWLLCGCCADSVRQQHVHHSHGRRLQQAVSSHIRGFDGSWLKRAQSCGVLSRARCRSTVTAIEDVSYVSSPYIPRSLLHDQRVSELKQSNVALFNAAASDCSTCCSCLNGFGLLCLQVELTNNSKRVHETQIKTGALLRLFSCLLRVASWCSSSAVVFLVADVIRDHLDEVVVLKDVHTLVAEWCVLRAHLLSSRSATSADNLIPPFVRRIPFGANQIVSLNEVSSCLHCCGAVGCAGLLTVPGLWCLFLSVWARWTVVRAACSLQPSTTGPRRPNSRERASVITQHPASTHCVFVAVFTQRSGGPDESADRRL
jgi:hypothetical protein